jgi:hypothetical protein
MPLFAPNVAQSNGGVVDALEINADIKIVDHMRKDVVPGRFVEIPLFRR